MTTIPTQIRARIDAIAAERLRLDDEERRLRKALEALEETAPKAADVRIVGTGQTESIDDWLRQIAERMQPLPPYMPVYPCQPPHRPVLPLDDGIHWTVPLGPYGDTGRTT